MKKKFLLSLMVIALSTIALSVLTVSAETEGIYTYSLSNGESIITGCDKIASGKIVIPDTLGGYPVTSISDKAFYYCEGITSVIIPNSVTIIGKAAFFKCTSLDYITIGENVTSIGGSAFTHCYDLDEIVIPDNVVSIGDGAFFECVSLKSVVLGKKVARIGASTFYGCNSLTSIIIPDSVTDIGGTAFTGSEIKTVTIGKGVTNIADHAFYGCDKLRDVYYNGVEEDWNSITIGISNNHLNNANRHYIKSRTETTLSNDNKSFTITPINIENGKTVILALYNGEQFVEMQSAVYTGEIVHFTTTKTYTKAKVMIWDDITNLKPICEVENIQ